MYKHDKSIHQFKQKVKYCFIMWEVFNLEWVVNF